MSSGGIYKGPDGQTLHGDGRPVGSPRSSQQLTRAVVIPKKQYFVYYWEWGKWKHFGIDSVGVKYAEFVYNSREEAEQAIVDYCEEHPWKACHWKIEETLRNPFYDPPKKEGNKR